MEPALKQRLVGAAVLVAIAVIFLPMLIKGPAPESGVSDVSLELPPVPGDGFETRELPLVTPQAPGGAAVTGMGADSGADGALPTVDTRDDRIPADETAGEMLPATAAGGDLAVSFGSYATAGDAQRVVRALLDSQLPGYAEAVTANGRTLHRVRIGPYASRADAENARLRAAHVRDDVGAKVVTLEADAAAASAPQPAPAPATSRPEPLPAAPAARTAASRPATATPAAPAPARNTPAPTPKPAVAASKPVAPPPATSTPAAASVGFAVQLGAFGSQAEALKLRDRARGAGLSAFVEDVNTDKGRLSRVQLGPVADRAAAEQLKAQAATRLGVNGFVRSHP